MKIILPLLLASSLVTTVHAALVEKIVTYQHGSVTLEGFHVFDDAVTGKRPAVLVIHQWTGLSDHEKRRSRALAELGYNVFAADVYGKGIRPQAPDAAGKEAAKYKNDRLHYRARLNASLDWLKAEEHSNPAKVAALGYCFGGTGVLELVRGGAPVVGVISFHGGLDASPGYTAKTGKSKAKVLVLHGADDPLSPAEQVAAFEKEFSAAKVDWQLVIYSGAVHAFTQKDAGNDNRKGAAYNASADRRSWVAAQTFLTDLFK